MKYQLTKKLAILLGATLLASSLTACGVKGSLKDNDKETTTQESSKKEESKTDNSSKTDNEKKDYGTLKISYPTGNIRVTTNILALEKGYFKEEGVDVVAVAVGGNDALTAINEPDGQLDVLTAGFVGDVQSIGAGYDLTFIAGTAVEGGAIIAKKGKADKFKGTDKLLNVDAVLEAKLGYVRNEASWVITRQYLLDNGVSDDVISQIESEDNGHVTFLGDTTATAQAVQKGEIELGFLPMEFALLYADAYDLEIVAAAGDLSPNYVCCREVTSKARYTEKYDAFVAYETARIRAYEYYKLGETDEAVRKDVVKIVSDYSGKEADYVETYLYGGVTKFAVDPNTAGIKQYVKAAYNSGVFSGNAVDFGSYDIGQNVDTAAYKAALDNLIAENPDNTFYQSLLSDYNEQN